MQPGVWCWGPTMACSRQMLFYRSWPARMALAPKGAQLHAGCVLCVCVRMCPQVCMPACLRVSMRICMHLCMHVCLCVNICVSAYRCMSTSCRNEEFQPHGLPKGPPLALVRAGAQAWPSHMLGLLDRRWSK